MPHSQPTFAPDWQEIADFLATPDAYPQPVDGVDVIDTSISKVYLAGERAYKIRRPVDLGFLDFTSLEKRRLDCEREVRLNRRTAPSLYLGIIAVTRSKSGKLKLGGDGTPVEWAVEMRRFNGEQMLDRQAINGTLAPETIDVLAAKIAVFHDALPPEADWGGTVNFRKTLMLNDGQFRAFVGTIFEADAVDRLRNGSLAALEQQSGLLDKRRKEGWVRHCHGDLHLANICCLDGEPTPFDCIEFSDRIARIDVLYDLAFLLMDLWRCGLVTHANRCLNQYAAHLLPASADAMMDGLALLPLFLSCRAAVRAFVMARTTEAQPDNRQLAREAQTYFALAETFLQPPPARLVAVGGLSGSGKSVLARAIAPQTGPVPGAVVLRSDEIRKQLCGVPPTAPLSSDAYTPEVSARVYACLIDRARRALAAGHGVIADAVHAREPERDAIEKVADDTGAPFHGLWLDASPATLVARVETREADASDADVAVVRRQLSYETGSIRWHHIDANGTVEQSIAQARTIIPQTD